MVIWKKQLALCILLSSTCVYASDHSQFGGVSDESMPSAMHYTLRNLQRNDLTTHITRPVLHNQNELYSTQLRSEEHIQEILQSYNPNCSSITQNLLTDICFNTLGAAGPPPDPDPKRFLRLDLTKYLRELDTKLNSENIFRFAEQHQETLFDAYWRLLSHEIATQIIHIEPIDLSSMRRRISDLFAPLRRTTQQYVGRENVENAQRRSRTKSAVEVIFRQVQGKNIAEDELLEEVIAYIKFLQTSDRHASFTRDNSECVMNEVDNALRTINGPKKTPNDFGSILPGGHYLTLNDRTSMSIKGLLARTWWIITNQFQDDQREMLQESLVKALGQCIEDDDHRVCGNGKTQRIVSVLQGYVDGVEVDEWKSLPTVDIFLKGLFAPINEELQKVCRSDDEEERQSYAQEFYDSAMQQARQTYGDSTEHLKEVQNHIIKFASLTLLVELEPNEIEPNHSMALT
ncbi:MAG: hypothetical protein ABFQ95_08215 [Pseudomonadota bacterium]